jgi:hypothetical protein
MHTFAQKPKATQQTTSAKPTIPGRGHFGQSPEARSILHLQRTIGNQAVQRILQTNAGELEVGLASIALPRFAHDFSQIPLHPTNSPATVQAKLTVRQPGDTYDQEADRIAEQVIRMPEPQLQCNCPYGGEQPRPRTEHPGHEPERVRTKQVGASDLGQIAAPPVVDEVISSPGQSLEPAVREFMERRFDHDFSRVRIHSDRKAAESAQTMGALAYTVGHNIVFGAGQYAPGAVEGQRLLAHELTHVVQQTSQEGGPGTVVMRNIAGHIAVEIFELLLHWLSHEESEWEEIEEESNRYRVKVHDSIRAFILLRRIVGHIENLATTFDTDSILYTVDDVWRIKQHIWEILEIAHNIDVGIDWEQVQKRRLYVGQEPLAQPHEVMLEGELFVKVWPDSWREKGARLFELIDLLQVEIEDGQVLKSHGPRLTSVPETPADVDPHEVAQAFFYPVSTGESVELNVRAR